MGTSMKSASLATVDTPLSKQPPTAHVELFSGQQNCDFTG